MLQKKTFFQNLTVKKVYSVIIQWHMFIFLFQIGLLVTHFKPLIMKCYLRIIKNYLFALLTINNSNKLIRINHVKY